MNRALLRRVALAAGSGVLFPLCFPDYQLSLLAWVVLIPLHLALEGISVRQACWLGWLSGMIAYACTMNWVVTAMYEYGKVPLPVSYGVLALFAWYLGAYLALYAVGVAWFQRTIPWAQIVAAPLLWTSLEWIRTYALTGIPWALLGYSQYEWLPVIQIADLTGVYGVSCLIVLVNVALAEADRWFLNRIRRLHDHTFPWAATLPASLALALALDYGYGRLPNGPSEPPADRPTRISIGVIQANVDQAHKWDATFRDATIDTYRRLTAQAAQGTALVIWPEAATPFLYEDERAYQDRVAEMIRAEGVPLLFGTPALRRHPDGRPYLLNSALLVDTTGAIRARYDKRHLVPFGEYIPLHGSLLWFLDKLVEGIGDFEAGASATVFRVATAPAASDPKPAGGDARFGVVICYEVIFPNEVRDFAAAGADFMVTITNDAWFGHSAAPAQHFAMVVFRAVENRRPFARAANTGISGFIDAQGRILYQTPIFQERAMSGELALGRTQSFYTRYGDVFAYACVIITGILTAVSYTGRRTEARDARRDADESENGR